MISLVLLFQILTACALSWAQFYGGGHGLAAGGGLGGDIGGLDLGSYSGEAQNEDTIPISQDELAQLMAQSLASGSPNYNNDQSGGYIQHQRGPGVGASPQYDGGDDSSSIDHGHRGHGPHGGEDSGSINHGHGAHGAQGAHAPHSEDGSINHGSADDYSGEGGQYDGQQDSGEAGQYQQHPQGGDNSHHQQEPQQNYEESDGYQNPPQAYQDGSRQYNQESPYARSPSASYSHSNAHDSLQDSEPNYDNSNHGQASSKSYSPRSPPSSGYSGQNPYHPHSGGYAKPSAAHHHHPHFAHYAPNTESSNSYPGGYASPSGSYLNYNVNHGPASHKFYAK